jgi:hypothetical protein
MFQTTTRSRQVCGHKIYLEQVLYTGFVCGFWVFFVNAKNGADCVHSNLSHNTSTTNKGEGRGTHTHKAHATTDTCVHTREIAIDIGRAIEWIKHNSITAGGAADDDGLFVFLRPQNVSLVRERQRIDENVIGQHVQLLLIVTRRVGSTGYPKQIGNACGQTWSKAKHTA